MFLQRRRNDYLTQPKEYSVGPASGLGESFASGFGESSVLRSSRGDADLFSSMYNENVDKAEALTGEKFDRFDNLPSFQYLAKQFEGEAPEELGATIFVDEMAKQEQRFTDLKKQYPQIQNSREVWERAKSVAGQAEIDVAQIRERETAVGAVADFAGAMAGSFTMSDPLNQASLFLGGVGKTIAARIMTEAGLNSGVEAINQFTGVTDSRRRLGLRQLSTAEKITSVAAAGIGAGVIRGGMEVTPGIYRAAENKLFPQVAVNRQLKSILQDGESKIAKPQSLSDDEYLTYLRTSAPKTEETRAAIFAFEREIDEKANNVFKESSEPVFLAEKQLSDFAYSFETGATKTDLLSTTARVDAGQGATVDPDVYIPSVRQAYEPDARAQNPELFAELDAQAEKVAALTEQADTTDIQLNQRTMADAIEALDAETGQRVRAIEEELSKPIPAARRQELERELDMVMSNITEDAVAKAENDFRIVPEKELRRSKKSLAAERRKLSKLKRDADLLIDRTMSENRIKQRIAQAVNPQRAASRLTVAEPIVTDVAAAGERLYKQASTPEAKTGSQADVVEEGGFITVGDMKIPTTLNVPVGTTVGDEGAAPVLRTVKQMLMDIAEDDKMIEAMKVCGL